MIINCRSCQQNKSVPVALVLYWMFHKRILFCLDCVPEETRTRMIAENRTYWKNRL